jgi:hypothetical protein
LRQDPGLCASFFTGFIWEDGELIREPLYQSYEATVDETPKSFLVHTIDAVSAVIAYADIESIDKKYVKKFLSMQEYDSSKAKDASYLLSFDLGKGIARILTDKSMTLPDLADLYGHPWNRIRSVGYCRIWVSHPDWSPLTDAEFKFLERKITEDIRYNYSEDELELEFETIEDIRLDYGEAVRSEDASYLRVKFIPEQAEEI